MISSKYDRSRISSSFVSFSFIEDLIIGHEIYLNKDCVWSRFYAFNYKEELVNVAVPAFLSVARWFHAALSEKGVPTKWNCNKEGEPGRGSVVNV